MKLIQIHSHDDILIEQLLPCMMTIFKGGNDIIEQYRINNRKDTDAKGITALQIALYRNHPIAVSELLLTFDPTLLNNRGFSEMSCLLLAKLLSKEKRQSFLLSFKNIETQTLKIQGFFDELW